VAETQDKVAIKCQCGGKFRVPAAARGKRIKCPKCAQPLAVPKSAPSAVSKPAPSAMSAKSRPIPAASDDLLADLAGHESAAPGATPSSMCPNCTASIASDALICVECGYNTRTGQLMGAGASGDIPGVSAGEAARSLGKAGAGLLGSLAGSFGELGLGVTLSALGAILGGVIWYAIARGIEAELGWIAVLVGLLAGIGMRMGVKGQSGLGALVAIPLAILAIAGAKYMYFSTTLSDDPLYGRTDEQLYADALATSLAWESLDKERIPPRVALLTPAGENPRTYQAPMIGKPIMDLTEEDFAEMSGFQPPPTSYYKERCDKMANEVANMSPSKIREEVESRDTASAMFEASKEEREQSAVDSFVGTLDHFDILWLLLASGSAWKAAAGADD